MRRRDRYALRAGLAAILAAGAAAQAAAASSGPQPSAGPTVIGTAAAGNVLTGLSGTWAGFGALSYHFQWYRCNAAGAACLSVHGATSPSYRLRDRDVGQTLGLTVSATDSTGTTSAYSSLIGPIAPARPLLEATAQPVVTGPPVQGKTIEATEGTWSPFPSKLSYRWERCNSNGRACAAIPRASGSSYTVAAADVGHALLALVQATNGSTIQNAFSTATPEVVAAPAPSPRATIGPSVAGTALVGAQLQATPGIWSGIGPIAFTYRWYRCDPNGAHCSLVRSSPSGGYALTAKDADSTIGLTLLATDLTGSTVSYASLLGPVAPAGAGLAATTLPTISGTARVGGTLALDQGLWSTRPVRYAYTWLRCNANGRLCVPIPGANGTSYRPAQADVGHTLVGDVVATAAGSTQAALSAATAPIT